MARPLRPLLLLSLFAVLPGCEAPLLDDATFAGYWRSTSDGMVINALGAEAKVTQFGASHFDGDDSLALGDVFLRHVRRTGSLAANAEVATLDTRGETPAVVWKWAKLAFSGEQMTVSPTEGMSSVWMRVRDLTPPPPPVQPPVDPSGGSYFLYGFAYGSNPGCTAEWNHYDDMVAERARVVDANHPDTHQAQEEAMRQEIQSAYPQGTSFSVSSSYDGAHMVLVTANYRIEDDAFTDCVLRRIDAGFGATEQEARDNAFAISSWGSGFIPESYTVLQHLVR